MKPRNYQNELDDLNYKRNQAYNFSRICESCNTCFSCDRCTTIINTLENKIDNTNFLLCATGSVLSS